MAQRRGKLKGWCHLGCWKCWVSSSPWRLRAFQSHLWRLDPVKVFYWQRPGRDHCLEAISCFEILLLGKTGNEKQFYFKPNKSWLGNACSWICLEMNSSLLVYFFLPESFSQTARRNELALPTFCLEISLAKTRSSLGLLLLAPLWQMTGLQSTDFIFPASNNNFCPVCSAFTNSLLEAFLLITVACHPALNAKAML